ncbi:MAG TPA: Gfo/Idh/MocA family oxidoreductase [Candidatus Acidoferrum sp.]|nr:Gfo/Idh/MocA family oxidoreductase [Candidatus Acidoferrum sp.]
MGRNCGRREFLRTVGGAALALPVGCANDRVNVAFVGERRAVSELQAACIQVRGFHIARMCDLADPAIDAVCIATGEQWRARMTVAACAANKDVYVAAPVWESIAEAEEMAAAARRYGRVVQAGSTRRSGGVFRRARSIVRSGELGGVAYCRIAGLDSLDLVHFVFDEEAPLSASVQRGPSGTLTTFRYPRAVVSCEPGSAGASFHGSGATLLVDQDGCRIFGHDGGHAAMEEAGEDELVSHLRDWLECIRTRRAPAGEIGKVASVARARALARA